MKQKTFTIEVDESLFKIEPAEKVAAFGKRLRDQMGPIRRDVLRKLKQSEIRAKYIYVR